MPYFGGFGFKVLYLHFFCDDRHFFYFLQTCAIFAKNISCQLIFNSLFHLAFCNHHILTEVLNHKPCHNIVLQWKNLVLHLDRLHIKTLSYNNPKPLRYHKLFDKVQQLFGSHLYRKLLFPIQ